MSSRLVPLLLLLFALAGAAGGAEDYTNFETVPVRPLALSPDGRRLYAVNTPDGRLEIFDVLRGGLRRAGSVAVGLEPVAVAARTNGEVWVVNHLSDSVSVVDVASQPPRVMRTLLVGDEPWDVVFAGPRRQPGDPFPRAFVSAARRGQNHPENPHAELKTPGVGRADVWVFDAEAPGEGLGGEPETIVRVFGDKPRGLAASSDGSVVYVGVFHSGNRTTSVNDGAVCDGGPERGPCTILTARADDPPVEGEPGEPGPDGHSILPGGLPGPRVDADGVAAPEAGLIVRFDEAAGEWRDELGRNWNGAVPFDLPDLDVFAIDALADVPVEFDAFPGVGTILFQMVARPDGGLFVANTEARNEVRFEGPGIGATTVRGRLHEARVSVIDAAGDVLPRHLNKHIDYAVSPVPPEVRDRSLAQPSGLALSPDGSTLYVAAFGSDAVGVFAVAEIEADTFVPDAKSQIAVPGGPVGLALDQRRRRLYVYTRFDNAVSVVDLWTRHEAARLPLHNPEPEVVRAGRRFLYDARLSSSNGESSCGSCHIFGDKDDLGWDLGNPAGRVVVNPNPFVLGRPSTFHPLKGPMTTQTLRGMANHGPMHWRGDRTGGLDPESGDPLDEVAAFRAFNGAFESLLGRDEGPIPDEDMQAFAEFALTIFPPPNPIRPLHNRDTPRLAAGRHTYNNLRVNNLGTCNLCHRLRPDLGFFGTAGLSIFDPGDFKIPHLRNVYDKVGAFGFVGANPPGNSGSVFGDQIRGFGLANDGSLGNLTSFLLFAGFQFPGGPEQQAQVEDLVLALPSNMAPIVGQQVTRRASPAAPLDTRIDLLILQARTPWLVPGNFGEMSCDLVVKGSVDGEPRGWVLEPGSGLFESDRLAEAPLSDAELRALAETPGQALTYTCTPPGSGVRMGIDRDGDGSRDADERDLGTDPEATGSVFGACSDGIDNDGDGAVDHPDDADCHAADSHSELSAPRVRIDVQPRSRRNLVSLGGGARLRVAVLGSSQLEVDRIDVASLVFGPAAAGAAEQRIRPDLNRDGFPDLVVKFDARASGLQPGDTEACLEGAVAGSSFRSCDDVIVVGPSPRGFWRLFGR